MRDGDELERERRQLDPSARLHDVELHLAEKLRLAELAAEHRGGERRGEDRAAQLTPEMGDGADVVLVRVGDDEAQQPVPPLADEAWVGHHDLDLGQLAAAEADAAIDREPAVAAAVKVQVHADLARPAQR